MTTTVRVHAATRDLVARRAAERHQTADQVIAAALAALEQQDRRAQARREALALRDDAADRAEVAAVQRDLDATRAG